MLRTIEARVEYTIAFFSQIVPRSFVIVLHEIGVKKMTVSRNLQLLLHIYIKLNTVENVPDARNGADGVQISTPRSRDEADGALSAVLLFLHAFH